MSAMQIELAATLLKLANKVAAGDLRPWQLSRLSQALSPELSIIAKVEDAAGDGYFCAQCGDVTPDLHAFAAHQERDHRMELSGRPLLQLVK